jgi:hypothetical protein
MTTKQKPKNNLIVLYIIAGVSGLLLLVSVLITIFMLYPFRGGEDITEDIVVTPPQTTLESEIKTPEISEEIIPISAQQNEQLPESVEWITYTNQFYPNLRISYPEDWDVDNRTWDSYQDGLLNRTITLSKTNNEQRVNLTFNFILKDNTANYIITNRVESEIQQVLDNGLTEYADPNNTSNNYFGTQEYGLLFVRTNIDAANYPEYQSRTQGEDTVVQYVMQPNPTFSLTDCPSFAGPCFVGDSLEELDEDLLAEVYEILSRMSY